MKYFITLRNATASSGAVKILKRLGINSVQGKKTDENGCHFGIYVSGDANAICRILSANGYRCFDIQREGDTR